MSTAITSIRLDTKLADDAMRALGAKTRTEAVHLALQEVVGNQRFKDLMRKHEGKLKFAGLDE
jgi:Arc/MetJ family transcription regulator